MNIPTLAENQQRLQGIFGATIGYDALQNPAINALTTAQAHGTLSLYHYLQFLIEQLSPLTAAEQYLNDFAIRTNTPRILATTATAVLKIEGATTTLPTNIQLTNNQKNIYKTQPHADNSPTQIAIVSTNIGTPYNLIVGEELTLSVVVPNISPTKITVQSTTAARDIEATEDWRARIVEAYQSPKRFGNAEDYQVWSTSAHTDIATAWVNEHTPFQGQTQITLVGKTTPAVTQSVIDEATNQIQAIKPAGDYFQVRSAAAKTVNFSISNVNDHNHRQQIEQHLQQLIAEKTAQNSQLTRNQINAQILKTTTAATLLSPSDTVQTNAIERFTMGAITWQ